MVISTLFTLYVCVVCLSLFTCVYGYIGPSMSVWKSEVGSEILSLLLSTYILFYSLSLNLEPMVRVDCLASKLLEYDIPVSAPILSV